MSSKTITKLGCALWLLLLIFGLVINFPQLALLPFGALIPISDDSSSRAVWLWMAAYVIIFASLAVAGFVSKRKAVAITFVAALVVCTLIGFVRFMIAVGHLGI